MNTTSQTMVSFFKHESPKFNLGKKSFYRIYLTACILTLCSLTSSAQHDSTFSVEEDRLTQVPEFSTKAEKQAYFKLNRPAKEITIISSDSTYPKFIVTGDKELDASNYAARKAEWVENNPDKYEKMHSFSNENAESIRAKESQKFIQKD